jgi:hypothetical protein
MIAGVILTVGIGLIAIYTSNVIGQVAVKNPHVKHYADAVSLIWGRQAYELCGAMFVCYLTLLVFTPPLPAYELTSSLSRSELLTDN